MTQKLGLWLTLCLGLALSLVFNVTSLSQVSKHVVEPPHREHFEGHHLKPHRKDFYNEDYTDPILSSSTSREPSSDEKTFIVLSRPTLGALRPHKDLRVIVEQQIELLKRPFMTLHTRIEQDMQIHTPCENKVAIPHNNFGYALYEVSNSAQGYPNSSVSSPPTKSPGRRRNQQYSGAGKFRELSKTSE